MNEDVKRKNLLSVTIDNLQCKIFQSVNRIYDQMYVNRLRIKKNNLNDHIRNRMTKELL